MGVVGIPVSRDSCQSKDSVEGVRILVYHLQGSNE